jgi:hypothetical protein
METKDVKKQINEFDKYKDINMIFISRDNKTFVIPAIYAIKSKVIKDHFDKQTTKLEGNASCYPLHGSVYEGRRITEIGKEIEKERSEYRINRFSTDVNNFVDFLSDYKYVDTETLADMLMELEVDTFNTIENVEKYLKETKEINQDYQDCGFIKSYYIPNSWNKYQIRLCIHLLNINNKEKYDDYKVEIRSSDIRVLSLFKITAQYDISYEGRIEFLKYCDDREIQKNYRIPNGEHIPFDTILKIVKLFPDYRKMKRWTIKKYDNDCIVDYNI